MAAADPCKAAEAATGLVVAEQIEALGVPLQIGSGDAVLELSAELLMGSGNAGLRGGSTLGACKRAESSCARRGPLGACG